MAYLDMTSVNKETDASTYYLPFVANLTGIMKPYTDSGLTYTPTSNSMSLAAINTTDVNTSKLNIASTYSIQYNASEDSLDFIHG